MDFETLEFCGSLVLVNSMFQAMPTYLFSMMMAPKSALWNIQRKFLWSGSQDSHKWALVKWDIVCKPKLQGGLGLRYPEKTSLIAREKVWWRCLTHSHEPWAKLWLDKYATNWDIRELIRFSEEKLGSHIWRTS